MAKLLLRGDGGGAENHYRPKQAQHQRHYKEPAVGIGTSRQVIHPLSEESCLSNSRAIDANEFLEDMSAMLVILKLVEAGAGRSENHDVARLGGMCGDLHGAVQGDGAFDGHAAGDLLFDFVRGGANQQSKNGFFAQGLLQDGVVAALVFSAENDQDAARKSVEAFKVASTLVAFESLK